jgi:hypothetical protein
MREAVGIMGNKHDEIDVDHLIEDIYQHVPLYRPDWVVSQPNNPKTKLQTFMDGRSLTQLWSPQGKPETRSHQGTLLKQRDSPRLQSKSETQRTK